MHELYIDSNGNKPSYPRYYRQAEKKLVKEQRKLSKMQKGSNNRTKQRIKVARVSDNGWGKFVSFLQYKLEETGKQLVKVDKFFASSQICNVCGYKNTETKNLGIRAWGCPECGTHHNRDVNAAINIRNEGMRLVTA